MLEFYFPWIGSYEPPQAVGVIPRSEVIEPGFRIPFFAGQRDPLRFNAASPRNPNAVVDLDHAMP